eukprot:SAG22_NODE_6702_length_821_cov_7.087258_1_plen_218_part_01
MGAAAAPVATPVATGGGGSPDPAAVAKKRAAGLGMAALPRESSPDLAGGNPLDFAVQEVRATKGRWPLRVEVHRADRIVIDEDTTRPPEGLPDALVVYIDHAAVPRALAALAAGATEVRLLPDAVAVRVQAERDFRFASQRVIGGALPPASAPRVWHQPLNRAERASAASELGVLERSAAAAEQAVEAAVRALALAAGAGAAAEQKQAQPRLQQELAR